MSFLTNRYETHYVFFSCYATWKTNSLGVDTVFGFVKDKIPNRTLSLCNTFLFFSGQTYLINDVQRNRVICIQNREAYIRTKFDL